ncbi:beta-glucosidase [Emydomyces testavorans]|uniref:glucan 1,3-beta-glucosidase n=1 Tax=Emydomyces testavorans TaxID=2070801 RepID=A0AAF0DHX9_9EURO|nr:beta-glucosidase [Emydomyces testavorans]
MKLKLLLNTLLQLSLAAASPLTPSPELHERARLNGLIRGVNLGGWLVLEPWITPSIFEQAGEGAVDEFTLCQLLGGNARSRLQAHWNSWITRDDFFRMAAAGLNYVRIPIGYWAVIRLNGEPYVDGQLEVLDRAIQWARETGLKVMIDLHGAPGSQNGFDNSGRRGDVHWGTGDTIQQTLRAIRSLAERYAKISDVVTAIELMNEPFPQRGVNIDQLKQFYYDGWGTVYDSNPQTLIVISDAFQTPTSWNGFMTAANGFPNSILDTHHYEIFDTNLITWTIDQHVDLAYSFGRDQVSKTDKPTIIGEWSGALTDCAKYLNGRGQGARYDGTFPGSYRVGSCAGKSVGTVAGLSPQDKQNIRRFIEAQMDAGDMGAGWVFWTWKTEGAPEWDMQQLIQGGVFPQPLTQRQYPRRG